MRIIGIIRIKSNTYAHLMSDIMESMHIYVFYSFI